MDHGNCVKNERTMDKYLSCIYVNAHSIIKEMDSLQTVARAFQPDIIGITESWANSDIADIELMVPGYDLFRKDRPVNSQGGGVLLYVKSIFSCSRILSQNCFSRAYLVHFGSGWWEESFGWCLLSYS